MKHLKANQIQQPQRDKDCHFFVLILKQLEYGILVKNTTLNATNSSHVSIWVLKSRTLLFTPAKSQPLIYGRYTLLIRSLTPSIRPEKARNL